MSLSQEELSKYRFSYVKVAGVRRHLRSRSMGKDGVIHDVWGDWADFNLEGILTFGLNGDVRLNYKPITGQVQVNFIEEVFKPGKDAIRRVCQSCMAKHAIGRILEMLRVRPSPLHARGLTCSICSRNPFTSRPGQSEPIYELPARFYRATTSMTDQEVWEMFSGEAFERQMKDWTMELLLVHCERVCHREPNFYRLQFFVRGEPFAWGECDDPPPSSWWEEYKPVSDLKDWLKFLKIDSFTLIDNRVEEPHA